MTGFSEHYTNLKKELDLKKTAILIVDMMNDFCKPGGKMVLDDGYVVIEPIQKLVEAGRKHGIPIVWICQQYRKDKYDKVTEKREGTCYEGTWGGEQIDELPILPEDYVVHKRRYSGFFQTDLDLVLRDMGCEKVIVGGVVTNICVRGTVADAFQLNYEVFVPKDAVRATSDREQESQLWDIETHFGTVTTVDELVEAMEGLKPEDACRIH
ncbi:cysteine hydrolase family protein [Clostridium sp. Marseille-P3244]|uniref:cysteine hydrolase family protein n=1 Tax=Clostridium sp. Marseille-P3244 TaxID=1871020 RepID=UPI00093065E5|nr:isochorismatase family cysteine hydrolase [Clostridium sp. Marseille-P3244]